MASALQPIKLGLRRTAILLLAALLACQSVAIVAGEKIQGGSARSLASAGTSKGPSAHAVVPRGLVTNTATARKITARATFLATTYGNWCGLGKSGPAAPIDNMDTCCKGHDSCHMGNCRVATANCNCQRTFLSCINIVLTGCSAFSTTPKCSYARNAKTYVTEVTKTACNGRTNLFCLITG